MTILSAGGVNLVDGHCLVAYFAGAVILVFVTDTLAVRVIVLRGNRTAVEGDFLRIAGYIITTTRSNIPGDGAAVHFEFGIVALYGDTAAIFIGAVSGDGAAVHFEFGIVVKFHAGSISLCAVMTDFAAVHHESAVVDVYASAASAFIRIAIHEGGIPGNGTTLQG